MRITRTIRFVLIGIAILLVAGAVLYFVPPKYDPAKVHPIVRGVHAPPKRLGLTPFRNGFLIECVSPDDRIVSALLEFGNVGVGGETRIWHKLQVKSEPGGQSERVDETYSDTNLALAALVNQYAKPGRSRDEALYWLTDGKKYRFIGALRAAKRKIVGT